MTTALALLLLLGIALPHVLPLQRSTPSTAAALWVASFANRALMAILLVLWLAFFVPGTKAFAAVTHWCWHTVLPVVTAHLGLDGHKVGDAATILPGLLVTVSLLSVAFGVFRAARAVQRLLAREALGPGPSDSVIVPGPDVVLAAAGLARPQVVVSAGALLELDDEELAAGLDHERGHIARRHRFLLVFAELCRGVSRFIPGGRRAIRELSFHLERDADQWALAKRHDRLALAGAICKAAGVRSTGNIALAPLDGEGARERLDQLIDEPRRRRSSTAVLLNLLTVAMVGATLLLAALVPSTALAGAAQFSDRPGVHHCDDHVAHHRH